MEDSLLGLSVIVCCYNSSQRLPETLKYLSLQEVPDSINWEVIIVNNASTDETVKIAKFEWDNYKISKINFKIIDQPIPGLSHAREKGFSEAKYEYVIFCDDDNWLCENYIATAYSIMSSDSSIGVLGGHGIYEPELPANPEIALHSGFFVNGTQTWVETDHWVYGAGAVYRRSVYKDLKRKGWQQITTGRIGSKLIAGEDVEICYMLYLMGYKIQCDERLKFQHFVPAKRQTFEYIQNLSFWLSYSYVLLLSYVIIINNVQHPAKSIYEDWLKKTAKITCIQLYALLVQKVKTGQNPTFQQKIDLQNNLGTLYSIFRNKKKIIQHHIYTKQLLLTDLSNN